MNRGILVFVGGLLAQAVACSFPDITYVTGGPGDGATSEVGNGAPVDARSDATAASADVVDATGRRDGVASLDAASTDATGEVASPTDVADADASSEAVGPEGGDFDADAGTTEDAAPDGPNCNCPPSSMYPTLVSCGLLAGLLCTQSEGFVGDPPCGTADDYVTCVPNGLGCGENHSTRVQQCR